MAFDLSHKMPKELLDKAYRASNGELAWPVTVAPRIVDFLATESYGILGAELWLVQSNGRLSTLFCDSRGQQSVWTVSVDRQAGEPWDAFALRAAEHTKAAIAKIDVNDIQDSGEAFVNLTWTDLAGFDRPQCK